MPTLVLPDQAGFIPETSTSHNLRALMAMYHILDPDLQAGAVMLDAAKAFDSIEWSYLFSILKQMGFPPLFTNWIRLLYTDPLASIRIDGTTSDPILICRGTRQGCPLSPLLFAITLEPLSCIIRQRHKSEALQFAHRPVIISLYADDMLLFVREPQTFLSPILREYIRFGYFSGLNINWSKSIIVLLTISTSPHTLEFPLTWSTEPVKYLGVWVH